MLPRISTPAPVPTRAATGNGFGFRPHTPVGRGWRRRELPVFKGVPSPGREPEHLPVAEGTSELPLGQGRMRITGFEKEYEDDDEKDGEEGQGEDEQEREEVSGR